MLTWTLVFSLWEKFTPTWNRRSSRNPLQFSQCFAWFSVVNWKTLFLSFILLILCYYFIVSVLNKLALKWHLMRMCANCVLLMLQFFMSAGGSTVPTAYEAASSSTTTGVHETATPGVDQQTSEFCRLCCNQVTLQKVISPIQNSRVRSVNKSNSTKDIGKTNNSRSFPEMLSIVEDLSTSPGIFAFF